MGEGDLPQSLCDRNQLPANAPSTHPDLHPGSAVAAVGRGHRPDPAERVGVGALGTVGGASPQPPPRGSAAADLPPDAVVGAGLRRTVVWNLCRNLRPTFTL